MRHSSLFSITKLQLTLVWRLVHLFLKELLLTNGLGYMSISILSMIITCFLAMFFMFFSRNTLESSVQDVSSRSSASLRSATPDCSHQHMLSILCTMILLETWIHSHVRKAPIVQSLYPGTSSVVNNRPSFFQTTQWFMPLGLSSAVTDILLELQSITWYVFLRWITFFGAEILSKASYAC